MVAAAFILLVAVSSSAFAFTQPQHALVLKQSVSYCGNIATDLFMVRWLSLPLIRVVARACVAFPRSACKREDGYSSH